jgi:hypothetical protein
VQDWLCDGLDVAFTHMGTKYDLSAESVLSPEWGSVQGQIKEDSEGPEVELHIDFVSHRREAAALFQRHRTNMAGDSKGPRVAYHCRQLSMDTPDDRALMDNIVSWFEEENLSIIRHPDFSDVFMLVPKIQAESLVALLEAARTEKDMMPAVRQLENLMTAQAGCFKTSSHRKLEGEVYKLLDAIKVNMGVVEI